MKNFKIIVILLLFIFQNSNANIESKIILKVDNKIITNYEIKNKILSYLIINNQEINQTNINNLKGQTVNSLILLKLKELEIEKYNLENNDKDLSLRMQKYLAKVSSNDINRMKTIFNDNGISFDIYQHEIKTELLWQDLIYKIYSKKIVINEESIEKEVEDLINQSEEFVEMRLYEIEVLLNNDLDDENKILLIKNNIEKFGFENTASKFSISSSAINKGDLGWINSKSLSKEIFNIVNKITVGDYSKPILRPNSVLFLMVKDKRKSTVNRIDKSEIKKQLFNQKKSELFNLYSQSHLSKLKNTSLITNL
tara:strand:- start:1264 stop:2196 length:933 start_codon:yes stop_codon:yes gene_type:complete